MKELCAALTYFCVHMHKDWPLFLSEIQQKFDFREVQDSTTFLRTLESLAEDYKESKLVVEDEIRQSFKHLLSLSVHQIFPTLQNFATIEPQFEVNQEGPMRFRKALIGAAFNWIRVSGN